MTMRSFLVFIFYLSALAFLSGSILNDEISSSSQSKTIRTYHQPQEMFYRRPQARWDQKIEKIMYIKHLMELKCLKKIFNDIRNKNRFRHLQTYKMFRPLIVSPHQNRILTSQNSRPYPIRVEPHKISLNNRIIFLPPKADLKLKQANKFQNKISKLNLSDVTSENFPKNKQNIKFTQNSPLVAEKRKENLPQENSKIVTPSEVFPKVTQASYTKFQQKLTNPKPTLPTYPVESYSQQFTKRTFPQEVTEPNREEILTDSFDEKNNFKNHLHDENIHQEQSSSLLRMEHGRKNNILKSLGTNLSINNSSNTRLRTLTESANSSAKKSKEIVHNAFPQSSYVGSFSNNFNKNSNNGLSDFNKKIIENKFAVSPKQLSEELKITLAYPYEILKSKEKLLETERESQFKTRTTVKIENIKSIFTKKVKTTPLNVLNTETWSESVTNSQQTTAMPEFQTSLETVGDVRSLNEQNILVTDQKFNIPTFIPNTVTENTINNLTTIEDVITEKENSSDLFFTVLRSHTIPAETTKEFLTVSSSGKVTENPKIAEGTRKMNLKTTVPEERLSMPIFTEFTDLPLTFDLLTTIKKDQEIAFKNSRKMHFEQETELTTTTSQISKPEDNQQRRSDILIDENLDDYVFYDSTFTSNYLKQLKQNAHTNSSSDFIIQLIPFVINDLREDRIPPEDVPILSKAFGEYWTTVLALTNNTELDMLPLLKMKTKKDFNNILQTYFPEKPYLMAAELKEPEHDNYLGYYYDDIYKDLGEDNEDVWKKEETSEFKKEEDSGYYSKAKQE